MMIAAAASGANVDATGQVEAVTLYRGQALVTRAVPVNAPAGPMQLTVKDLPHQVVPSSLFASAGDDVRVRAVRYRTFAVAEEPKGDVRKLDQQIKELEKKLRANQRRQRMVANNARYLDNLGGFVAATSKVEMQKGVLNADTLAKVSSMMMGRRAELVDEELKLTEDAVELAAERDLLQRKRANLARGVTRTVREALIFLEKVRAGKSEVRLSYLVSGASWEPTYNLRSDADMKNVLIEYTALARQMSGEDWTNVKLTLSTAQAQMVADGPVLAPLWIGLSSRPVPLSNLTDLERWAESNRKQLSFAQKNLQKQDDRAGQWKYQWEMNKAAEGIQVAEIAASASDVPGVKRLLQSGSSGLSVNYKLESAVSLSSRSDSQMVEIARLRLPAKSYHEAVPLLSEYVYRYAEISNTSDLSLLQGAANVFLNGDFVGTSTVPMVARGQTMVIGMGINPQLRAMREFVDKDERTQGGNRRVSYQYRIVLENYADKAIPVRVMDRVPVSKADIKMTLGDLDKELSKDSEYQRAVRPQGILRWDVTVPKRALNEDAMTMKYGYNLEFDRKLHVAGVDQIQSQQQGQGGQAPAPSERRESYFKMLKGRGTR
jgi:uncharacterized protein (TIGR02231 family)